MHYNIHTDIMVIARSAKGKWGEISESFSQQEEIVI